MEIAGSLQDDSALHLLATFFCQIYRQSASRCSRRRIYLVDPGQTANEPVLSSIRSSAGNAGNADVSFGTRFTLQRLDLTLF